VKGFHQWEEALEAFEHAEIQRVQKSLEGPPPRGHRPGHRLDLIDGLRFLVKDLSRDQAPTLAALEERIARTFKEDETAGVVLSTVHRAKGREANRVLILYPELMPGAYAKTPEAIRGEECVQFVALTRSKRDLVFVEAPPRADRVRIEARLRGRLTCFATSRSPTP
jgi:DNA helicase II / ATP-dependent DNA helicase PcrA